MALALNTSFEPAHGTPAEIAPGVVRVTANNPSPFTFHGTNSYLLGRDTVAVIDPGPEDEAHLRALLAAIGGRPVSHVIVTHTHRDHSPLARRLAAETGAEIVGCGPHVPARPRRADEIESLDAGGDRDFRPDRALADGMTVEGDGWRLRAIATPGHTANHLAFALEGRSILFSGDHVMAWSTTVVAPPDGSMADYMASLDRLMEEDAGTFLPGHGGEVAEPGKFLRGLRAHRKMRERAIVERIVAGDRTIAELVSAIYRDTDPRLHRAAGMSVLAHLEDLVARGVVRVDGEAATLASVYEPA